MVKGLDIFKEYFEKYHANYVIIGGTACDIIINKSGFIPRATKDIDIILIVEVLNTYFVKHFWQFVKEGDYEKKEKSEDQRKYYRFTNPGKNDFPYQIELFSRKSDLIELDDSAHLTPIPVDDDLSSLSAILLNDDYYNYMIEHSTLEDGIRYANIDSLICLKAKAFLEITERIENGNKEDNKQLRKHKNDIFRLAVLLAENDRFVLPENIMSNMRSFSDIISNDLPDTIIFKEMGLRNIKVETIFENILKIFNIEMR